MEVAESPGGAVDRHRIELQIRAVTVTFRIEQRRRDASEMHAFRARARSILDSLADEVRPYPELETRLQNALEEVEADTHVAPADPRPAD
jgi:hypothetical protein